MRLKELRMARNMTQETLAKLLKISPSAIGMYEQGRREPNQETLLAMADYFGVTIDYLLERDPAKATPEQIEQQKKIDKLNALFNQMTPEQQALLISLAENIKK